VCELAGITRTDFVTKSITKEEIVKEMFVVLNQTTAETTGGDRTAEELRKVIDALQQTISAQKMVIEMQSKMMEQFSSLVKR
jgi:hypothetical protein